MSKKILGTCLAVAMVLSMALAGCGSPASNSDADSKPEGSAATGTMKAIAKEDLKIGFAYVGPADDGGYTYAHDQARLKMMKNIGLNDDQCIIDESIPEDANCETRIRNMIDQGCNVIYSTSFGFQDYTANVAKEFPEVYFAHATGNVTLDNMSTYMGRIYQPRYLSGIVAGMKTSSNKIGYVAAMPIPEVIRGINAFTIGVRSVNPEATVEVLWTNSWYDPALEKSTAIELLNKGCDVIAQHCDTTGPQMAAQEKGAYAIGYNASTADAAPDAYLTAPLFHWDKFYTQDVQKIIDGTWKGEKVWLGLESGLVSLDTLTKNCAEGTQEKVDEATNKIKSGEEKIFVGPLKDNTGAERVKDGVVMTDDEIWNCNWFVEGVIGTIPNNN